MTSNAPPQHVNVPLIHSVVKFYKKVYLLKSKISKRDEFGIYLRIEITCLELLAQITQATFETKLNKTVVLNKARIHAELLKQLFRITGDLNIIPAFKYIEFESDLQEISKMINGWIKYLTTAQ